MTVHTAPAPELLTRTIPAGEARVVVMRRTYDAPIEDVWEAITDPERLARWYTVVEGELRLGGQFTQVNMGGGEVLECRPPSYLRVALGGGVDEIEVRLTARGEATDLEVQHATTIDQHEIGGEMYDAVFCMGGGYYPRLHALGLLLAGDLPADYDSTAFHLNPAMRPHIDRGSADMQALLDADT